MGYFNLSHPVLHSGASTTWIAKQNRPT